MAERKNWFDEDVARRYDETSATMFAPDVVEPTVELLADLAGEDGSALELGVGTGRIALPLRTRIRHVHGIDLSAAMIEQLRRKPGADEIGLTVGDCATTRVDGTFDLVYIVWNTLMNLTTQDEQVDCFRNAATHLRAGGRFVVDIAVPQLQRLPVGERYVPFLVSESRVGFDEYDVVSQGLISHHYWVSEGSARTFSMPFRYAWPAELDLMARLAGMSLVDRWGSWTKEPFTDRSGQHVSVWRKDG
ncbi:MAG: class I SAM-dependent DNA methyltransferase [Frankiaceae bacterium]